MTQNFLYEIYDTRLFLIIYDIRLFMTQDFPLQDSRYKIIFNYLWYQIIHDTRLFLIIYDTRLFLIIYDIRLFMTQDFPTEFMVQDYF